MKSIMEEASSVFKATEKAWTAAGKPSEFTVKILEEAESRFFGLSGTPAKIALVFDEKHLPKAASSQRDSSRSRATTEKRQPRERRERPQREQREPRQPREPRESRQRAPREEKPTQRKSPVKSIRQEKKPAQPAQQTENKPQEKKLPRWNDEMVAAVEKWTQSTLDAIGKSNANFTTEVKNYHLKIMFNAPIFVDEEKERQLFRSFAHLIMQSLRNTFKKGFRGYKIILNSK